jgi:hypothetical protein
VGSPRNIENIQVCELGFPDIHLGQRPIHRPLRKGRHAVNLARLFESNPTTGSGLRSRIQDWIEVSVPTLNIRGKLEDAGQMVK